MSNVSDDSMRVIDIDIQEYTKTLHGDVGAAVDPVERGSVSDAWCSSRL